MKKLFSYFLLCIILFSCNNQKELKPIKIIGSSIGTIYHITYYDKQSRNFSSEISHVLNEVMLSCNIFDTNSTISKINHNQSNELDIITKEVLSKSIVLSKKTEGYFDVTSGILVDLWGFGPQKSRINEITQQQVDSILQYVGYQKLEINGNQILKKYPEIMIDFGAIAKGYAVDLVADFLDSKEIENYLVEIGGEIFAKGSKPNGQHWVIGISVPDENDPYNDNYQNKIYLQNKGLATSGNYRNFYKLNDEKRVHTINPLTGYPVENELLSVTIIADDCMTADGLATSIMVMGLEKGKEIILGESSVEAYFIYHENDSIKTFTTEGFEKLTVD